MHNLVNCIVTLFPPLDTTINTQLWLSCHKRFFILFLFTDLCRFWVYGENSRKIKKIVKGFSYIVQSLYFSYIVQSLYFHQSFKFCFRGCSELATGMEYFGISVCQCNVLGLRTRYIFKNIYIYIITIIYYY